MRNETNSINKVNSELSKTNLTLYVFLIYLIYLLIKLPVDFHNLGTANVETYYLIDAFSIANGATLYKDIFQNKGPLQFLFYVISLLAGGFNEFAIIRVRVLQSFTFLISLFFLTLTSNIIFRNKLITLLTPAIYIYLPLTFKGLWGPLDLDGLFLTEGELIMSPFVSLSLYFIASHILKKRKLDAFLSGVFSSLAVLTKLSGSSLFLAVLISGIVLLLVLKDRAYFHSFINLLIFAQALFFLLQYIVYFSFVTAVLIFFANILFYITLTELLTHYFLLQEYIFCQ